MEEGLQEGWWKTLAGAHASLPLARGLAFLLPRLPSSRFCFTSVKLGGERSQNNEDKL